MASLQLAIGRIRRFSAEFVAWWLAELRAMLPPRVARFFAPPINEVMIEHDGSRLLLRHRTRSGERLLGEVPTDGDAEMVRTALRDTLREVDLQRVLVALRLPGALALRRIIELPEAAEENLRQVLAFDMDRLTPFTADAVHFEAHVLDRDREARRIRVEFMVLPRSAVDPAVDTVRRFGVEPDVLAVPRLPGRDLSPWRVPLATNGGGAGKRQRFRHWLALLLAAVAVALIGAGINLRISGENERIEALDRQLLIARKEAQLSRQLQQQIDQLSKEGNFIVDRKLARPALVEVLAELTRVTPDEAWLYRLRYVGDELQTFGYSPNASSMIGFIESSPLFSAAQFRAPLTRDQRFEAEQFHIAFQVGRKAQR